MNLTDLILNWLFGCLFDIWNYCGKVTPKVFYLTSGVKLFWVMVWFFILFLICLILIWKFSSLKLSIDTSSRNYYKSISPSLSIQIADREKVYPIIKIFESILHYLRVFRMPVFFIIGCIKSILAPITMLTSFLVI